MNKDLQGEAVGMEAVARLEEAVAHLQRLTDELSDVVARQDREIARLDRRVSLLLEREADREAAAGTAIPLADQRPPHW